MVKKKSKKSSSPTPNAEDDLKAQIARAKASKAKDDANEEVIVESVEKASEDDAVSQDSTAPEPETEIAPKELKEEEEISVKTASSAKSEVVAERSASEIVELENGMFQIELDNVVEDNGKFYRGVQIVDKQRAQHLLDLDNQVRQNKTQQPYNK